MINNTTLYFKRKNKKNLLIKELSNIMNFDDKFYLKKNIYLENSKYLVVISKHFIRVLVFNNDRASVEYIENTINSINTSGK